MKLTNKIYNFGVGKPKRAVAVSAAMVFSILAWLDLNDPKANLFFSEFTKEQVEMAETLTELSRAVPSNRMTFSVFEKGQKRIVQSANRDGQPEIPKGFNAVSLSEPPIDEWYRLHKLGLCWNFQPEPGDPTLLAVAMADTQTASIYACPVYGEGGDLIGTLTVGYNVISPNPNLVYLSLKDAAEQIGKRYTELYDL